MTAASGHSAHWAELDLLRAMAGSLMVANHAGVTWLPLGTAVTAVDRAVVFAGSLAPVIFFTVTGIGRGLQVASAAAPRRPFSDTIGRALVLFLADAGLWLSPGSFIGMDFLGFIGLSTVVLELANRSHRPAFNAAAGAVACLALRFLVGPHLGLTGSSTGLGRVAAIVTGQGGLPKVSYLPVPWLVYPLFGFCVGRWAATRAARLRASRGPAAAALAVAAAVGFVVSIVLAQRGLIFFRWGAMSFAYAVFSFAALFAALALALLAVARVPASVISTASLPGLASFIIVPVHYVVVTVAAEVAPQVVAPAFPLDLVILIPAVIAVSKWIDQRIMQATRRTSAPPWRFALGAIILSLLLVLVFVPATAESLPRLAVMAALQLVACVLFAMTSRRRVIPASAIAGAPASIAP